MAKKDMCDIYCYDEPKVKRIQNDIEKENIAGAAKIFKALADENRAKISFALCQEEELCVCDIANIIGSTVATASHHLRSLHKQGIVRYQKVGKLAFYSLDNETIKQVMIMALSLEKEVFLHV
ncbi:ArsR/SmtB family transcription factor [Paraliobacillus sediminis]|uniref:ArsR/SmtB family transcription factor n=1 Tax=Paraliobacillus sediminis TaxID=1885916 RepID=UPI000E3E3D96|nr:metalloregulator ArsR/SmtB family transcription factor [Paraliobacillus sediminis]